MSQNINFGNDESIRRIRRRSRDVDYAGDVIDLVDFRERRRERQERLQRQESSKLRSLGAGLPRDSSKSGLRPRHYRHLSADSGPGRLGRHSLPSTTRTEPAEVATGNGFVSGQVT